MKTLRDVALSYKDELKTNVLYLEASLRNLNSGDYFESEDYEYDAKDISDRISHAKVLIAEIDRILNEDLTHENR